MALTLAGSVTRTVKYDTAATTDADYPCFQKETMKLTKNKAVLLGARYRSEEKGDWKYWTDYEVGGYGQDENEKWYGCAGDKQAETPSGVKCMQGDGTASIKDIFGDFCTYDNYMVECEYNTDQKKGGKTVEDAQADYDKNKSADEPTIVEEQLIFWECEFDTADIAKETSATCAKPKLVKTKHDGTDAKKCFAAQFSGLVSAVLVLTGLMN